MSSTETLAEAERVMTICNACRYCEGHCAVFPAMELRLAFPAADLNYLAHLCHNCGSWYHHLTIYGFMLAFAATCVATVYHYAFGWEAPYPPLSLPVVLGTVGGIGLLIGPAGLLWLKREADPEPYVYPQRQMDVAFLVLLFLSSLTGLLLLVLRATPAMGVLLAVHLGVVLGLFLTMPYGKFIHAIYRFAALVRYAIERRRPPQLEVSE